MIHITGDTHGDFGRFDKFREQGEESWGEGDVLTVCGDFGYVFADDEREREFLDGLEKKPYTICFVDGNHENFPAIYRYRTETWNGGRVHAVRKNVLHLMRGQVFEIEGKTFFTMGGAYSVDRYVRREGLSYWKEELPDNAQYREAAASLAEHGMKVDYVLTHTAPREIIRRMGNYPDAHDAELTGFLEWVMYEVEFKGWFFGHWHVDRLVKDKFRALFFDVVDIE